MRWFFYFMNVKIEVYFNDIEGERNDRFYFKKTIKSLENLYNNGIKLSKGDEIFIHNDDLEIIDENLVNEFNLDEMFILTNTCFYPSNNSFLLQFQTL